MKEKATLSFDLTDPDARESFHVAVQAKDYRLVLWDMDQYLRSNIKYGGHTEEIEEVYRAVRERLHELLEQWEITL